MKEDEIMILIIDRFEGEYAICECADKKMIDIPIKIIPFGAKEGDVLHFDGTKYLTDEEATKGREEKIKSLMKDLWAD